MATLLAHRRPDDRAPPLPPWATGLIGIVGVVAVWWLIALITSQNSGPGPPAPSPPPPSGPDFVEDGLGFYWPNITVTLSEAAVGFLWGDRLALLCWPAWSCRAAHREDRRCRSPWSPTACRSWRSAPIAFIRIGGPPRGDPSGTAIFLAALSVFFTTVVGTLVGLKAADTASLDLVTVYGGTKFTQLRKVRLIAGLPSC